MMMRRGVNGKLKMVKGTILSLFVFAAAGISSSVWSADASLVRISGEVQVRARGKTAFQKAYAGFPLSFGDLVQTQKAALAQVLFPDGNAILIKENTTLRMGGKPGKVQINIPAGEFLIGLKQKLARGKSLTVKTPAAVAAVRGTLFWGLSDAELNTTYACFQSAIEITAGGKSVTLKQGEKTFIPYGKPAQKIEPANVPLDYLDTFAVDGSIEGFKEMLQSGE